MNMRNATADLYGNEPEQFAHAPKEHWGLDPNIKAEALNRGLMTEIKLAGALDALPHWLNERQAFRDSHSAYLGPEGRSPQALLDAEMELGALLPDVDEAGKVLSIAAKDRELRRLKATDAAYLKAKEECRTAAAQLERLDNDIEVCRAALRTNAALLGWQTALINMEGE